MRGIGKNSIVYNYCAKRKQKRLERTVVVLRGADDSVNGHLSVTGTSPLRFSLIFDVNNGLLLLLVLIR
jgi:hypothetical protein